jgi:hypothetical protein
LQVLSIPSLPKNNLEQKLQRLNGILDVIVHLFPESSERFDYDEEILTLIFVARDLAQDMHNQVNEGMHLGSLGDVQPEATFPDNV